ncbi:type II toxin-antitoxin system HicA family toxin [Dehalococcoidia bacterium]|nr:type II toxin-antitoxin system HicA family toxin [Dehalococcoidia bacterium]
MTRLTPVSWDTLVQKLRNMTFEGPYRGGKHYFMLKDDFRLTIPNPHAQDIGIPLLKEILKRAGISREEWLAGSKRK